MKLNNKGFAITGILYGLLILFALLVASYLTVLTARKNRLDGIISDIEEEYNNTKVIISVLPYTTTNSSNCTFEVVSKDYGDMTCTLNNIASLSIISFSDGSIKINDNKVEFTDDNCDMANAFGNFTKLKQLIVDYS